MDNCSNNTVTIIPQTKFCAETAKVIVALAGALEADLANEGYAARSIQRTIEELIQWGKIDA